jgi:hypothetical protein
MTDFAIKVLPWPSFPATKKCQQKVTSIKLRCSLNCLHNGALRGPRLCSRLVRRVARSCSSEDISHGECLRDRHERVNEWMPIGD